MLTVSEWVTGCLEAHPDVGTPLGAETVESALGALERSERLLAQVEAARLALVAELQALRGQVPRGAASTADLVARSKRVTGGRAAGDVRLAESLATLPALKEAFAAGDLSRAQAEVAVRQVQSVSRGMLPPERRRVDAMAAARAQVADPVALRSLGEELLRAVRPETAEEELLARAERQRHRAWANRHLRLVDDEEGNTHLRGSLPALEGGRLRSALEAASERARRTAERVRELPTREQRLADALVALIDGEGVGAGQSTVAAIWRADELVAQLREAGVIAPADLGEREPREMVDDGGEPPAESVPAPFGRRLDGSVIAPTDLRRLACGTGIIPMILGSDSVPLDVGRVVRLSSKELRAAVHVRDGGCVFPGCSVPPERCDQHHVVPWSAGGATSLDNLVDLCPHHHGVVEPIPGADPGRRWRVLFVGGLPAVLPPVRPGERATPLMHERLRARTRQERAG